MKFVELYSNMVIMPLEEHKKKLIKQLYYPDTSRELIQEMLDKTDIELYKKYEKLVKIAKEEFEFNSK